MGALICGTTTGLLTRVAAAGARGLLYAGKADDGDSEAVSWTFRVR